MNWLVSKLDILGHKFLTSRKAILSAGVIVFASLAMWCSKMPASVWLDTIKWVLSVYLLSQGAADAAANLKGNSNG